MSSTMGPEARAGATGAEWAAASAAFLPRILPCVCDPEAKPKKGSSVQPGTAAKVPSIMRGRHTFSGLAGWTRRPAATEKDAALWQTSPEHGILCRTGALEGDGVLYALDADLEDAGEASEVLRLTLATLDLDSLPVRSRGSSRWACLIREPDGQAAPKRVLSLRSGAVEILGAGDQLACAGTHPSGQRYRWDARRADGFGAALAGPAVIDAPAGTVERLRDAIEATFAVGASTDARREARHLGESYEAEDTLAGWLKENAEVLKVHPDGRIDIKCPWRHEHTGGGEKDKPQDATYFPAGLHGYPHGGFRCLHAHSGGGGQTRTAVDLAAWARGRGWAGSLPEGAFPALLPAGGVVTPLDKKSADLSLPELMVRLADAGLRDDAGRIEATADSVALACGCPACIGYDVRFDAFQGDQVFRRAGQEGAAWADMQDAIGTDIRRHLERAGFKARGLGFDLIGRCLDLAASERRMDSMRNFLEGYAPTWDGVPRWRDFFARFCGATDAPEYLAALGGYVGAALWARASCEDADGVKADIVPVLIGAQGARKSTLVQTLAIDAKWATEISLDDTDAEIARKMRGRLTIEIPELRGLAKRELTALKALLSRAYDDVRPLYRQRPVRYARRGLLWMTTNEEHFLSDPTGNRRFAPVHVSGVIDIDGVRDVLPQLWAEGRELAKARAVGLRMGDVEALSASAIEAATVSDEVDDILEARVDRLREEEAAPGYSRQPITMDTIMHSWLGWPHGSTKGGQARNVAGKLQRLGMVSVRRDVPGGHGAPVRRRVWELAGCAPVRYEAPTGSPDDPFS